VSIPTPPVRSDWEARARGIASDATRIPLVFRLLIVHILMDSIRTDHEMFVRTLADMSGIPLPAPAVNPAMLPDSTSLFDSVGGTHALTSSSPKSI
jgi:hypothetical protein